MINKFSVSTLNVMNLFYLFTIFRLITSDKEYGALAEMALKLSGDSDKAKEELGNLQSLIAKAEDPKWDEENLRLYQQEEKLKTDLKLMIKSILLEHIPFSKLNPIINELKMDFIVSESKGHKAEEEELITELFEKLKKVEYKESLGRFKKYFGMEFRELVKRLFEAQAQRQEKLFDNLGSVGELLDRISNFAKNNKKEKDEL